LGFTLLTSAGTFWAAVALGVTPLLAIFFVLLAALLIGLVALAATEAARTRRRAKHAPRHSTSPGKAAEAVADDTIPASPAPIALPPDLLKLFETDFPGIACIFEDATLNFPDGSVQVKSRFYQDFSAGAKFVAFYVPDDPNAFCVIQILKALHIEIMQRRERDVTISMRPLGEDQSILHSSLKFTGTIYIYCPADFDLQQKAALEALYRQDGLSLRLRGPAWLQAAPLRQATR
jgi:hypothetical protein